MVTHLAPGQVSTDQEYTWICWPYLGVKRFRTAKLRKPAMAWTNTTCVNTHTGFLSLKVTQHPLSAWPEEEVNLRVSVIKVRQGKTAWSPPHHHVPWPFPATPHTKQTTYKKGQPALHSAHSHSPMTPQPVASSEVDRTRKKSPRPRRNAQSRNKAKAERPRPKSGWLSWEGHSSALQGCCFSTTHNNNRHNSKFAGLISTQTGGN